MLCGYLTCCVVIRGVAICRCAGRIAKVRRSLVVVWRACEVIDHSLQNIVLCRCADLYAWQMPKPAALSAYRSKCVDYVAGLPLWQ